MCINKKNSFHIFLTYTELSNNCDRTLNNSSFKCEFRLLTLDGMRYASIMEALNRAIKYNIVYLKTYI